MKFPERVFDIVRAVPTGMVVTYGQVAALAGYPRRARHVGQALSGCPSEVPWQRVVGAGGCIRLSPPHRQVELLRFEGVAIEGLRVDLRAFQWRPGPLAFALLKSDGAGAIATSRLIKGDGPGIQSQQANIRQ